MFNLIDKSEVTEHANNNSTMKILELKADEFNNLVAALIGGLPDNYVNSESIADTLDRLGKNAAAQKLRIKLPEAKNIRSGDIGEILTFDYIEDATAYSAPIHKLRWRDHRNMAMRGDDIIGILVNQEEQTLRFLKTEAKANKILGRGVLQKAREELDLDNGLPAPHALGFVSERLRETGDIELSNLIEKVQLVDGIDADQVEHLLFTFTASNPATLQKESFEAYNGEIKQNSVGFRVAQHQELIVSVYEGVIDGLDD